MERSIVVKVGVNKSKRGGIGVRSKTKVVRACGREGGEG